MPRLAPAAALALAALTLAAPLPATAGCSTATTGARCIAAIPGPGQAGADSLSSASAASPGPGIGSVLERGEHSILLNAEYYGLPPVSDGWVYMRVDRGLYRVDWASHQVLEDVTHEAAANF